MSIKRLNKERQPLVETLNNTVSTMDILFLLHTFQENCESAKFIIKENRPQTKKKRIQKLAARLKEERKLCLLTQVFPLIMYVLIKRPVLYSV